MSLLSSSSIIRSLSLFHLATSYYLLTSPQLLANQNLVFILTNSMQLPAATPSAFSSPTHATAVAAVGLAFLGLADLTAVPGAGMPEDVASTYWSAQAPVRVAFWMALSGYVYMWRDVKGGVGAPLRNGLVFTLGFLETAAWFWVYVVLREERRALVRRRAEEKRRLEERVS